MLIGVFEMLLKVSDAMHFRVLMKLIMKVFGTLLTGISAVGSIGYFITTVLILMEVYFVAVKSVCWQTCSPKQYSNHLQAAH